MKELGGDVEPSAGGVVAGLLGCGRSLAVDVLTAPGKLRFRYCGFG